MSTIYHDKNEKSVGLRFLGKYSFPNSQAGEIKNGDFFTVQAPSQLGVQDATLVLRDPDTNEILGSAKVNRHTHIITFTFNEKVDGRQNVRGDFVVFAYEQVTKETKTITYTLPGGKTQTVTFAVKDQVIIPVEGDLLSKNAWNSRDPQIGWNVRINRSKMNLNGHTIKIKDKLNSSSGAYMSYIENTFELHEAKYESTNTNQAGLVEKTEKYEVTTDPEKYRANSDKMAYLKFVDGKQGFELLMPTNTGDKSFFLFYYTTSPTDTSTVRNSAQFLIDNEPQIVVKQWGGETRTDKEAIGRLKTVKTESATCTTDIAGKIKITKYDEDDTIVKLAGIEFDILKKDTEEVVQTVKTDENGIALTKALSDGKYIVKEKSPKSGYIANSKEFEVEMKGEGVPLNISNKRETVDFEATKNWKGGNASNYKQVKLGLYFYKKGQTIADAKPTSKEYTPEVTNNNGVYTYKWKNQLPKLDIDGTELVYTVRELQDKTDLPLNAGDKVTVDGSNYVVSYNAEMTAVTNTYEVPKTNVTAKKVWVGGKADARPKFYFKLYRTLEGGTEEEVTGAELKEVPKTDGTVEWTNLPATDANAKKYTYSVKETDKDGKSIDETVRGYTPTQTDATTITNTYKLLPTTTDIFVAKELTGKRPTPLQADEFEFILKDEKGTEVQRAKNDANGQVVFKDIPFDKEGLYKFTVVEANGGQTINGVTHDSRSVGVTVSVYDPGQGKLVATPLYDQISALTAPFANFATSDSSLPPGAISVIDNGGIQKFVNTYKATKVKVPVAATKTLINKNTNEPIQLKGGEFEFTLFNEDGNEEKTAKNDKDGNVTFPELEFDKAGTYTYTIKEVKAGTTENGITYDAKTVTATVTVTDDGKGKLSASVAYDGDVTFTNTYTPAKTQVSVTKVWDDDNNQDGLRPTKITVNLLADGVKLETKEIQAAQDGTWSATFTDLPKYKDDKEIKYTVTEEPVEGYVSEITADTATNFTIKNTHAPATVSVQGTKTWDDGNNQDGKRPDKIKVLLNKTVDGVTTKVAEQEVTKANWTYEFKNLPKFEGGKEITYSIDEEAVEGYVKAIDGYNLKNSYTPAKTQIPVKKVWNDADNQDGKRPAKIIVKLLADGQDTGKTLELSEANGWAGSFTELDAHKGGKAIDYKVVEATSITGYTTEVTEDAATGFTITNSYTPETVDIKATKNWDDANNQDGKRPSSITINLLADGEKVDSKEVKAAADGTWSAEFKAKAKYKNGNEIKYTVTEEKVTEYETKIEDFNIINKYIPKAIEYKVTKVWNDANNQDGKRPTTVTVQLYKSVAGSEPVALEGKTLTITAENKTDDNTWVASFTNLPQFENGQEIAYSIQEVNVPEGYTESVTGQVVTNTHEPETIVITGTKKWVDNNNQYGKRTATVKVQILKGNTVVDEVETSEEKGWAFASKPLPKYENGEEIAYKVQEVAVESYESEVKPSGNNQYTITNTLTQKIAIMGQKPWNDTNNQDNIRPTEITVRLLADGKDTDKVATASAATGWKYSFEKLAKYEAGKEITYTVEEVEVPEGYTPKVDGMNITNSHTPEKPQIPQTPPSTPEKSKKRILPSTGSQNSFLAVLAGLFTLSGAAYLLKKKA